MAKPKEVEPEEAKPEQVEPRIAVKKGDETIHISPVALEDHRRLGWQPVDPIAAEATAEAAAEVEPPTEKVAMTKDGEKISVSVLTVEDHRRLGWVLAAANTPPTAQE